MSGDRFAVSRPGWLTSQAIRSRYQQLTQSDFVHKVAATFLTRVILLGLGLLTSVFVTRTLGPEGRGLYATMVAVSAIGVQFGNVGLHASNTYFVARERTLLGALLGNALLVSLGIGALGVIGTWFFLERWPQWSPLPANLLALTLAWIPFGLAYLLLQNLLLGIQAVGAYNRVEVVTKVLSIGLIAIVILWHWVSPQNLFLINFAVMLIGTVWVAYRLSWVERTKVTINPTLLGQTVIYGFKAYLSAFFAYLVLRLDLLMVKQMLGIEQAGFYAVAASTADLIFMLPSVSSSILFPRLSALSDMKRKYGFTLRVTGLVGLLMGLICTVTMLFAEPLLTLLYGVAFLPAAQALIWLMPGIFFLSLEIVLVQFLNSEGYPWRIVIAWAISLAANIGLNLWLIPLYGIMGAAVASSVAYSLMFLAVLIVTYWWSA